MHLTDHISDVQLNEFLDNESNERAEIESHLASCADCAARLTALESLFAEIESLPDLKLSASLAARFTPTMQLSSQLPRWLTLTASLQAAIALIALILAAPFIVTLLPPIETPSLTDAVIQLQMQWASWLNLLSSFHFPSVPQLPLPELPSLVLASSLAGVSLLWLVGNGLLLRNQIK